ncbi:hypothetical protein [Serpentinimonas maccroryi]|uniref:hypothetical protein n=1 Tax=Serpentinimonas maccroryi TaxID=1458426 RepID=UPI0020342290|nr:hypothetical protein [Serpentinimonas maccroryi]
MKLKQWGLKLGLALVAAGLMAAQAHAADGFDGAVEPMALGAALPMAGAEVQAAAPEQQVGSATPLPVTAVAAGSSGPLGVEGSAALAAFSQADIATLFEPSAAPLQLAALSEQEMRETEGAVIWFAPVALHGFRFALTGFTRHGLNQVISREGVGVNNRAILSTLRNPTTAFSDISNRTTRFIGPNATVVLNQSGRLVTAWGRAR